jgi:hypothetical protein
MNPIFLRKIFLPGDRPALHADSALMATKKRKQDATRMFRTRVFGAELEEVKQW